MIYIKFKYVLATVILAITPLHGYATSLNTLHDNGSSDTIIFPDPENAWVKGGVNPNLENLSKISSGMTKDNIYSLLGHPHFSEGIIRVREWDYLFNFNKDSNTTPQICQYKIIYDDDMHLRNTYWKPESCGERLKPQQKSVHAIIE